MNNSYSASYSPATMCGEPGYSYEVRCGGRIIGQGWTRGKKRDAEECVRWAVEEWEQRQAERAAP